MKNATYGLNWAYSVCLVALLLTASCVTRPSPEQIASLDYGPAPEKYEETIKKYFDNVLIDPYSAQYEFGSPQTYWLKLPPIEGGQLLAGWFVRVSVNAKNRMGGYGGKMLYGFLIKNEQIIKVMDDFAMRHLRQ